MTETGQNTGTGLSQYEGLFVQCAKNGFEKAVGGASGFPPAEELALRHMMAHASPEEAVRALVGEQAAAVPGRRMLPSLSCFPGIACAILVIPGINCVDDGLSMLLAHNMRMIAAIAHVCGFDPRGDRALATLSLACLAGKDVSGCLEEAGLDAAWKAGPETLRQLTAQDLEKLEAAAGRRAVRRTIPLGLRRTVPLAEAEEGGSEELLAADRAWTEEVGRAAMALFLR